MLALAITLTTPATAQIIPTGTPAADILLSQAITEHRTFLVCSVLDPATHALIADAWRRDAAAAAAILTANDAPPENLLPAPETPFADVVKLCTSNPGWQQDWQTLRFTVLALKLPQAFE
ncbi:MAG: hypothetical protein ACK4P8_03415 [Tabrizicola sp.]